MPTELAAETAKVTADAEEAWAAARRDSDFAAFEPWLDRVLELKRRYVECFAPYDDPYDPLLDDFEPGMKTVEVRAVFDQLKQELVPLIAAATDNGEDEFMRGPFPDERQHALSTQLIERFGTRAELVPPRHHRAPVLLEPGDAGHPPDDAVLRGRADVAVHSDARVRAWALRVRVSPTLERTPLCAGASTALHESQSRLWENVVGRSRPFWRWFFPSVQQGFPDVLGDVDVEAFYRAVNRVRPSLIRGDATRRRTGSTS